MKTKRPYRMTARAQASEETRLRVIDAAVELFLSRDPDEISVEAVAERAGVTLQTVLRKFGSKDGLFAAAAESRSAEIVRARDPGRSGDTEAALRALVVSYEQMGELNWRLLRFEHHHPAFHQILTQARINHRDWLARTFAHALPAEGREREQALDALFAATDFYVWRLSRIDLGRTAAETEATMLRLVVALVGR